MVVEDNGVLDELASAEWAELTQRLLSCARYGLAKFAPPERRRFDKTAHAYVVRTVTEVLEHGAEHAQRHQWTSLFQLAAAVLLQLINDDDAAVERIVAEADWDDVTL